MADAAGSTALITAAITSSLSLISILIGLAWNAVSQRKADERKYLYERKKDADIQENKVKILRVSLLAEISYLVKTFEKEISFVEENNSPYTWVPIGNFFLEFENYKSDLGFLTPEVLTPVVEAYYVFNEEVGYVARNGDLKLEPVRAIGYDLTNEVKRRWLLGSLYEIVRSSRAALQALDCQKASSISGEISN